MSKGQIVGYVRVSSVDQKTVRQLDGMKLDRCFEDKLSGKNTDRPELIQALGYVREGDTLIVHSMDRLARNLRDLLGMVEQLTKKKVIVRFIKENLTFTGENDDIHSKLLLGVLGSFAEFERAIIRERQREGIAIAKRNGKFGGRKYSLTVPEVDELKQMARDRYGKVEIAKKFGICRRTVYKYLASPPGFPETGKNGTDPIIEAQDSNP